MSLPQIPQQGDQSSKNESATDAPAMSDAPDPKSELNAMKASVPGAVNTRDELTTMIKSDIQVINSMFPNAKNCSVPPGPFRCFSSGEYKTSMADNKKYMGVGSSSLWLIHEKLAPLGYAPAVEDVQATSNTRYSKHMDRPDITRHVTIACFDLESPGEFGQLVRLNGDKDVLAATHSFANIIRDYNALTTEEQKLALMVRITAWKSQLDHWPFDYVYVKPDPNLSLQLFAQAFQDVENLKITEEEYAASAWEICCSYAKVRGEHHTQTAQGVHDFLAETITFSKSSADYACRKGENSKGADNALLIFDKAERAGIKCLLVKAKPLFGLKSALTQMGKLILSMQKAGSEPAKIRWLISFLYMRLNNGALPMDAPIGELRSRYLPDALTIFDLVTSVPAVLPYPDDATGKPCIDCIWVECTSANPLWIGHRRSLDDKSAHGTIIDLQPGSKMGVKWMESIYRGEEATVIREMSENCKSMQPTQKLSYEKLDDIKIRLAKQFAKDTAPAESAPSPHTPPIDPAKAELDELKSRESALSVVAPPPQLNKDQLIKNWYSGFSNDIMNELFIWTNRPLTKDDWRALFSGHSFIVNRRSEVTAWVWDPDLDREVVPQENKGIDTTKSIVDALSYDNFLVGMESVVETSQARDVLVVNDAKHRRNFTNLIKPIKKCNETFYLLVTYKQNMDDARTPPSLSEQWAYCTHRPFRVPRQERMYYKLTTTDTDAMLQADKLADADNVMVSKELKESIHGSTGIPRSERGMKPSELVPLYSKERNFKVWREHLHTLQAKRAVVATPGGGPLLKALIQAQCKALLISRSETLTRHLQSFAQNYLSSEIQFNTECEWYTPRSAVIKKLGLSPDEDHHEESSSDEDENPAYVEPTASLVEQHADDRQPAPKPSPTVPLDDAAAPAAEPAEPAVAKSAGAESKSDRHTTQKNIISMFASAKNKGGTAARVSAGKRVEAAAGCESPAGSESPLGDADPLDGIFAPPEDEVTATASSEVSARGRGAHGIVKGAPSGKKKARCEGRGRGGPPMKKARGTGRGRGRGRGAVQEIE